MESAILAPLCAYTLLLFAVWACLGYVRISGVVRGTMPPEYLRVGQGPAPSEKVVVIHRHFSNQFEVPVLLNLGCLGCILVEAVTTVTVTLAWSFVVLRVVHTVVVLINNNPRVRVGPYVLSTLAVWALWFELFRVGVWSAA